jgi:hypothetical protein
LRRPAGNWRVNHFLKSLNLLTSYAEAPI